jgi:periplasmic mercuric ion binding protein
MKRSLLLLLFPVALSLQAQVQYILSIEIPTGVSGEQVLSLFQENPDFQKVALRGEHLTLVVPSREDYPILTIREMLATLQVAAKDYQETVLGSTPEARVQTLETTRFKVYGNCGMCEERIQRAARSVKGVVAARWDEETGMITVKYQPGAAALTAIHQAIADVGHDTDQIRAEDLVYKNLHHCCKYQRPEAGK